MLPLLVATVILITNLVTSAKGKKNESASKEVVQQK